MLTSKKLNGKIDIIENLIKANLEEVKEIDKQIEKLRVDDHRSRDLLNTEKAYHLSYASGLKQAVEILRMKGL